MTILQETILDRMKKGVKYGLDENLVKSIWELLHKQSFKIQSELLNRSD
jgi:chorismate mutase